MANLYESDNFNIVSVFTESRNLTNPDDGTTVTSTYHLLKVQRLPEREFPQLTDVTITDIEIAPDASMEDFLTAAPSIVAARLAEFDAVFSGEPATLTETSSLTQKFV